METNLAAIIIAVISLGIAIFQVLLTLGFPLGEATMGGYYKVLPKKIRLPVPYQLLFFYSWALFFCSTSELSASTFPYCPLLFLSGFLPFTLA
nr:hypothetical protein [Neobacillus sp. Marseille-Q6967]